MDIFSVMLQVVGLVAIGSAGRALKILTPEHSILLNNIALNFLIPALVFVSIHESHQANLDPNYLKIPLAAFLIIGISGGFAYAIGKVFKLSRKRMGAFLLTAMFGSTGFVGLPIVQSTNLKNNDGLLQHGFYSELGSLVLLVTVGIVVASFYGEGSRFSAQNLLAIPKTGPFIAMVLALLFYNDKVPDPVINILKTLSAANLPIIMFSLGITIVWKDIRDHLWQILALNGIKLILAPLTALVIARILGFGPQTTSIVVIDLAVPAIVLCVAYAVQYKLDVEFASEAVFSSFFFSVFTVPLITLFLPAFH